MSRATFKPLFLEKIKKSWFTQVHREISLQTRCFCSLANAVPKLDASNLGTLSLKAINDSVQLGYRYLRPCSWLVLSPNMWSLAVLACDKWIFS